MQLSSTLSAVVAGVLISGAMSQSCPDGRAPSYVYPRGQVCCKGLPANTACLAGCDIAEAPCFPECPDGQEDMTTKGVCTTVPYDDPNYTNIVYGGAAATPRANNAVSTTAASSASAVAATLSSGASAATGMTTATTTVPAPSISKGAAAAMATQPPMMALAGAVAAYAML